MLFSTSSSILSPPPLLFSSSLKSTSPVLADKMSTPDHHPCSSRYAIQWDLSLLFIALASLPVFLLVFFFLDFFTTARTSEQSKKAPLYDNPIFCDFTPSPPSAPQFGCHSNQIQTVDQCRHWCRAPYLRREHAPTRRRGNGPTNSLR